MLWFYLPFPECDQILSTVQSQGLLHALSSAQEQMQNALWGHRHGLQIGTELSRRPGFALMVLDKSLNFQAPVFILIPKKGNAGVYTGEAKVVGGIFLFPSCSYCGL